MRHLGRITVWKDDRGFGFITPESGGEPVFVHVKGFAVQGRRATVGEAVTYAIGTGQDGRPRAEQVEFANGSGSSRTLLRRGWPAVLFAFLVLGALSVGAFTGKLPAWVAILYVAASVAAFAAYALDKAAARNDRQRTPENNLHFLALIGGWPGALISQQVLRHKSKKWSFRVVFWLTVILNSGVLVWFFVPPGAKLMRALWHAIT